MPTEPLPTPRAEPESPGARAERAGLNQAKVSRIEGADAVPTLPLLRRVALALDASLNIALDDDREEVTFIGHGR